MTDRDKFLQMAKYFLQSMEGDDHHIEAAYKLMQQEGIVDEEGFEIYEEE